jgi:hypothetical protein
LLFRKTRFYSNQRHCLGVGRGQQRRKRLGLELGNTIHIFVLTHSTLWTRVSHPLFKSEKGGMRFQVPMRKVMKPLEQCLVLTALVVVPLLASSHREDMHCPKTKHISCTAHWRGVSVAHRTHWPKAVLGFCRGLQGPGLVSVQTPLLSSRTCPSEGSVLWVLPHLSSLIVHSPDVSVG